MSAAVVRRTRCIDCRAEGSMSKVAAPRPGPRCLKHHRLRKKEISKAAHAKRIEQEFEMPSKIYWAIYEWQGGRCYVCRRATGARKRLAIDHEHGREGCDHDPEVGCPRCWRGLLCGPCNQTIGLLDVAALKRAIEVLEDPPAQRFLKEYAS
jgi:hypothetical protein